MTNFLSHRLRSRLAVAVVVIAAGALTPLGVAPPSSADEPLIRITKSDSTLRPNAGADREKDSPGKADSANDRRKRALIASVLILGRSGRLPFGSFK